MLSDRENRIALYLATKSLLLATLVVRQSLQHSIVLLLSFLFHFFTFFCVFSVVWFILVSYTWAQRSRTLGSPPFGPARVVGADFGGDECEYVFI